MLLVIPAAVPAFAADGDSASGGPSGSTGAPVVADPPPAPDPAPAEPAPEPPQAESTPPSTDAADEPTDPATDPVDPAEPPEPSEPTPGTGATGGTGQTGATGPVIDDVDENPPAEQPAAPATGSGTPPSGTTEDGPAPRSTGTLTEDKGESTGSGNAGAQAGDGQQDPVIDVLAGRTAPSDADLASTARRTASGATDQIQRNAESGVAAGLVVTRIISEIPAWVFWALAALGLIALAGLGLYMRERLRRRSAEQEAMVDELTGISNRKAFDRRLDLEWRRAARYGRSLGLMVMDLDGFKQVNDIQGHAAGDRVLHDVAQALDGRMRDTDLVARIGGDEFAVICPETGINELMTIRRQLTEQVTNGLKEKVGLSIGVAEYVPSDDDATSILARADESMYRVKRGEATALPA